MKSLSLTSKPYSYSAPASKSIANRAIILAALSHGTSELQKVPDGDDVNLMITSLRLLGCTIEEKRTKDTRTLWITGMIKKIDHTKKGTPKTTKLYTGNAGTTTRFILSLATLLNKKIILSGSTRMQERPIEDLVDALRNLGANITYNERPHHLPVTVHPQVPVGGDITIDMSRTSQFATSILLIAPFLERNVSLRLKNPGPSISYFEGTLALLKEWSITYEQKKSTEKTVTLKPQKIQGRKYNISSDISSASYIITLAILHCTKIVFKNYTPSHLHAESTFFNAIEKMGCKLQRHKNTLQISPPKIRKPLGAIGASSMPDTALTLAVLAALTPGKSILQNIGHLKYKECDRLKALKQELTKLGAKVILTAKNLTIWGREKLNPTTNIQTYGDHRMALAFSIMKSQYPQIAIHNPEVVQKSYPNYWHEYRDFMLALNKNIVLIGMPAAGKTALGKELARQWKYHFVDLDAIFESNIHTSIATFVKTHGWAAFRKEETAILETLKPNSKTIISTGGGVVLQKKNIPLLKKLGTTVYLETTNQDMLHRLTKSAKAKHQRPNLEQATTKTINDLASERVPLYDACSQIKIPSIKETSNLTRDLATKVQALEQKLFYTHS